MHHRAATLLVTVAVFLAFPPAHVLGQDAEDATAATMIMADDLEFAPIEIPGFDSGMEIAGIPAMGAAVEKEKFLNSSSAWALDVRGFLVSSIRGGGVA